MSLGRDEKIRQTENLSHSRKIGKAIMFFHTYTKLVPPKPTHLTTNLNIRTNIHNEQMYSTKKLYRSMSSFPFPTIIYLSCCKFLEFNALKLLALKEPTKQTKSIKIYIYSLCLFCLSDLRSRHLIIISFLQFQAFLGLPVGLEKKQMVLSTSLSSLHVKK